MGGVSGDEGAGFDFDGTRLGWRLYTGHGGLGVHNPGPYLVGGKPALIRLCKAARRFGWQGLVEQAGLFEAETATWLEELTEEQRGGMVKVLDVLATEI